MVVSNRNLLFQRSIFRCHVSFREGKCISSFPILFHTRLDLPGQHFRSLPCLLQMYFVYNFLTLGRFPALFGLPNTVPKCWKKTSKLLFLCLYLALDWVEKIHLLLIDSECQSPSRGVFILTKLAQNLVINEVTWGPYKWLQKGVTVVISQL